MPYATNDGVRIYYEREGYANPSVETISDSKAGVPPEAGGTSLLP